MYESFDVPVDCEDGPPGKSGEKGRELRRSGQNSHVTFPNRKFGLMGNGYPEDGTRYDVYTCANTLRSAERGDQIY